MWKNPAAILNEDQTPVEKSQIGRLKKAKKIKNMKELRVVSSHCFMDCGVNSQVIFSFMSIFRFFFVQCHRAV